MEMPDALSLKFTVPLVTIADLMDQHKIEAVALIKIDVEGFELSVLRGLRDRIKDVKNVIFEALDEGVGGRERNSAVCEWLTKNGFELRTLHGEPFRGEYPITEGNLWAARS